MSTYTNWNRGKKAMRFNELKNISADYALVYSSRIALTLETKTKKMNVLLSGSEAQQMISDLRWSIDLALNVLAKNIREVVKQIDNNDKNLHYLPYALGLMNQFGGTVAQKGQALATPKS